MDAILKSQAEQLANELATQVTTLDDLNGLMRTMMKTALERMLNTEMDVHLRTPDQPQPPTTPTPSHAATDATDPAATAPKNRRNGHSQKTVSGDMGEFTLKTPRDRNGTFEPQLIAKGQRRLAGLRREDPGPVRQGDDHPRHPGDRQGTLRRGGVAHAGLGDHRRPRRRGHGLAHAAARCGLADRLPRRHRGARAGRERPGSRSTRCTWPSA